MFCSELVSPAESSGLDLLMEEKEHHFGDQKGRLEHSQGDPNRGIRKDQTKLQPKAVAGKGPSIKSTLHIFLQTALEASIYLTILQFCF